MPCIVCPLCRLALERQASSWTCPQGHSFDVAREGYVNLLAVQHKHSREPGDNPGMVQARRAFLDAGHYAPLRQAALALLAPLRASALLDLGCGEGYYTSAFTAAAPDVTGLDIAKPAIRLAARRYAGITWLVGSNAALPLPDESLAVVTSLFSHLQVGEMYRVLRPGGHALVVTPAAPHLHSLREALFDAVREHQPEKFLAGFGPGFELRRNDELRFPLKLQQPALRQLLLMTPYAWKARPERRAALEARQALATEAAFSLMLFRRK
ncbi:MAG: methyltransferase domain-containing protein [Nevskia sp.]|nr:methyltransferase domain-containing protein [Nevskia sp.]